jgi:hypothetical protein
MVCSGSSLIEKHLYQLIRAGIKFKLKGFASPENEEIETTLGKSLENRTTSLEKLKQWIE